MRTRSKNFMAAAALAALSLFALALLCGAIGMRVNTTRSIPLGFYWISSQPVQKGVYVFACPPASQTTVRAKLDGYLLDGPCPGSFGYLMKKVAATAGDLVAISSGGVRVNGALLPFSIPLTEDRAGRPLHRFHHSEFVLGHSELLLMSDVSATSFDGRYFGPVNQAQIRSVIVPVLTW